MIHEKSGLEYLMSKNNSETLVILLHGYGASQYDLFDLNEYLGPFDYIFPNGPIEIPMGWTSGFAWFEIDMEELNRSMLTGEKRRFEDKNPPALESSIEKVITLVKDFKTQYKRIYLGGFSQGSMITSHVVSRIPEMIDGFILFSSSLINKNILLQNLSHHHQRPAFIQSHGTGDGVLNFFDAKNMYELLKEQGFQGEFLSFQGAHEIPMSVIEKTASFLVQQNQ